MESLKEIVIDRDSISEEEFESLINDCWCLIDDGENLEDIVMNVFGLEPDYVFDLVDLLGI